MEAKHTAGGRVGHAKAISAATAKKVARKSIRVTLSAPAKPVVTLKRHGKTVGFKRRGKPAVLLLGKQGKVKLADLKKAMLGPLAD